MSQPEGNGLLNLFAFAFRYKYSCPLVTHLWVEFIGGLELGDLGEGQGSFLGKVLYF